MTRLSPRIGYVLAAGTLVVGSGIAGIQAPADAATAHTSTAFSRLAAADSSISNCALSSLPDEATDTADLIKEGGPFPYPNNDGVVFQNREGILPSESSSYYHEYTVKTPGATNRGTRRIITGGTPLTDPDNWYYTGDHYESFCKITGV